MILNLDSLQKYIEALERSLGASKDAESLSLSKDIQESIIF